jgi:hypothetical protein
MLRALPAIIVAMLPLRWWGPFERHLPVREMAAVSGGLTMMGGFALGIPGYLAFVQGAGSGANQAILRLAAENRLPEYIPMGGFGILSPIAFAFFTPLGLIATYLCVTGLARAASAWLTDDPRGDPTLTLIDAGVRRLSARASASRRRRARERLEGPETADRLVTGEWAGLPKVDYVVLASRRKPGWEEGVFVITGDVWYRLGKPFDMPLPFGLRTAYPLTEIKTLDVLRKGVRYELPPLWRDKTSA